MTSYRDRHLAGHYTAPSKKPKNTGATSTKAKAKKTTKK